MFFKHKRPIPGRYCLNGYSPRILRSSRALNTNDTVNSLITQISPSKSATERELTYTVKDNFATGPDVGANTTSASKILSNYESPFSATVVSLIQESGAKLIGKNNMDEFGMGSSNTNSYYGTTLNPKYLGTEHERITGGSSGGSAAAVAADLVDFSLGTDTGGSVRLPARYCDVIGFKPSYGRISRWGVVAYAQSLDTVGILSKDIDLVESVFNLLDKHDHKDPTSIPSETRERISRAYDQGTGSSLTIGVPEEFLVDELSPENKQNWLAALTRLQEAGHTVKRVSLPSIKKSLSAYYTIATAEAASNLSRFDGIRYGFSEESQDEKLSVGQLIAKTRSEGFGKEVQKRILLGNYTLSSDSGNHYVKATQVRKQMVNEFNEVFQFPNHLVQKNAVGNPDGCDILLSPTSVGDTPTIEEFLQHDKENFLNSYVNDLLTVPASLAGLPAISIPWGAQGLQIISQFGDEKSLFKASRELLALEPEMI